MVPSLFKRSGFSIIGLIQVSKQPAHPMLQSIQSEAPCLLYCLKLIIDIQFPVDILSVEF